MVPAPDLPTGRRAVLRSWNALGSRRTDTPVGESKLPRGYIKQKRFYFSPASLSPLYVIGDHKSVVCRLWTDYMGRTSRLGPSLIFFFFFFGVGGGMESMLGKDLEEKKVGVEIDEALEVHW